MKYYPYRVKENSIPFKLLKVPELEFTIQAGPPILEQQRGDKRWSVSTLQKVFDYYCEEFKSISMTITNFFDDLDPENKKFTIRNVELDEGTAKAVACLIPFITDITEVELRGNGISDMCAGAIILACFTNVNVSRISF